MKTFALTVAAAAALAASALVTMTSRAEAIEYPYCLSYIGGWSGMIERCEYTSMEQCQMSAQGLNGSCAANWRYAYGQPQPVEQPIKRRYRHAS
jgi:hypothetical protein